LQQAMGSAAIRIPIGMLSAWLRLSEQIHLVFRLHLVVALSLVWPGNHLADRLVSYWLPVLVGGPACLRRSTIRWLMHPGDATCPLGRRAWQQPVVSHPGELFDGVSTLSGAARW
jgi:hypothetical protein